MAKPPSRTSSVPGSRLSLYECPDGEQTVRTTIAVSSTNREIAAVRQSVRERMSRREPMGRSESFI
jgi:hypothetical protein